MDNYVFFIPVALVALVFFFFLWKLWSETEESGRRWMPFVVTFSMPVVMAVFASIFHPADGFEILLVGVVYALIVTCILRRINTNAG